MKKRPCNDRIKDVLERAGGAIDIAARALKCKSRTVRTWIKNDPELQEFLEDVEERNLDIAENYLFKNVVAGNVRAQIFYLSNKGKKRGWGLKQVDVTTNGEPIKPVVVHNDTDEELTAKIDELLRIVRAGEKVNEIANANE